VSSPRTKPAPRPISAAAPDGATSDDIDNRA
jgi:hypothetical protein